MEECSYDKDDKFSKKMHPFFMEYYLSDKFQKQIQQLSKRGKLEVIKVDDCDNPIFQKETYLDCIVNLSNGTSLLIDEKAERHNNYIQNFSIEVVSNPSGKQAGWGYHLGRTILKAHANPLETGFFDEPMLINITQKFVDEIVRSDDYPFIPNKATNGLYRSGFRPVPKSVLVRYFP